MENMTIAMKNFEKWYRENVTTITYNRFCEVIFLDGYAQHCTDDGKLFKATIATDGSIYLQVMKNLLSDFRSNARDNLNAIIETMVRANAHKYVGEPIMSCENIGDFAYWAANDNVCAIDSGLDFDNFTNYVLYEEDFEHEIIEITFSNSNEEKSSKVDEIAAELEISSDKIKILTKRLLDLVNEGEI